MKKQFDNFLTKKCLFCSLYTKKDVSKHLVLFSIFLKGYCWPKDNFRETDQKITLANETHEGKGRSSCWTNENTFCGIDQHKLRHVREK